MKNGKMNTFYVIAFLSLFLVMFNIIVFAFNKHYEWNFWSGYLFTTVAYITVCFMSFLPANRRKTGNEVFYAVPIMLFSALYMVLQFLVGFCVIFIRNFSVKAALLLQFFLFVIYLVFALLMFFYKGRTEGNTYTAKAKRFFKNDLEIRISSLTAGVEGEMRMILEKLKEQIHYETENLSSEYTGDIENEIMGKLDELEQRTCANDVEKVQSLCSELSYLLRKRNELCKNRM